MNYIFSDCFYLEYINLKNFYENKITSATKVINIFNEIPDNIVICYNNNNVENDFILNQLTNKTCYIIDCSENWKSKQKKIINRKDICVDNCKNDNFYTNEYNGKCYEICDKGYLINNSDNKICKCELDKCLTCPPVALKNNLCSKCNTNYYPIENDVNNIGDYINC